MSRLNLLSNIFFKVFKKFYSFSVSFLLYNLFMINKTLKKNPNTSILFCLISISKLSSYHHGFKSNTRGKNEIKKKTNHMCKPGNIWPLAIASCQILEILHCNWTLWILYMDKKNKEFYCCSFYAKKNLASINSKIDTRKSVTVHCD